MRSRGHVTQLRACDWLDSGHVTQLRARDWPTKTHLRGVRGLDDVVFGPLHAVGVCPLVQHELAASATSVHGREEPVVPEDTTETVVSIVDMRQCLQ